jgi:hypothetical protein
MDKDDVGALFQNFDTIVDLLARIVRALENIEKRLEVIQENTDRITGD